MDWPCAVLTPAACDGDGHGYGLRPPRSPRRGAMRLLHLAHVPVQFSSREGKTHSHRALTARIFPLTYIVRCGGS